MRAAAASAGASGSLTSLAAAQAAAGGDTYARALRALPKVLAAEFVEALATAM